MAEKRLASSDTERRGGYSGGKPASAMGPPKRMPSGAVKATSTPKHRKTR